MFHRSSKNGAVDRCVHDTKRYVINGKEFLAKCFEALPCGRSWLEIVITTVDCGKWVHCKVCLCSSVQGTLKAGNGKELVEKAG